MAGLRLSPSKFDSSWEAQRPFLEGLAHSLSTTSHQAELNAILSVPSDALSYQDLLHFARRLQAEEKLVSALELYAWLDAQAETPGAVKLAATKEANALQGKGSFGARAEVLLKQVVKESTDARVIVPMLGASIVGSLFKSLAMGRLLGHPTALLTRGAGARLAAGVFGFGAEGLAFAGFGRAMGPATGEGFGRDLARSYIGLGALKLSGSLGRKLLPASSAMGAASWMQRGMQATTPQFTMFLGMLTAHKLETRLGLRPATDSDHLFADTLAAMISLQVGTKLGHAALGKRFYSLQQELEIRTGLGNEPKGSFTEQMAHAEATNLQFGAEIRPLSSSKGENSRVILMSSLPGKGNENKPSSPGDQKDLSHAETEVEKFPASGSPRTPLDLIAGFGLPMMAGLGWLNWLISRVRPKAAQKALPESTASTALSPVKSQSIVEKSKEKPEKLNLLGRILSLVRKLSTPKIPDDLGLVYSLRKTEGWKFPVLNESTYQSYFLLAQARSWPLEMVMARALKNAPMEEVESWMERLFPGDLLNRIYWIQKGKIRGGWKLLLDTLRAKPWDGYRQTLLLQTISDLQIQEVLPDLNALLKDFVGTYFNYGYRMDIFKTILSLKTKENALEFLDQQLKEPWLNEGGPANHESKKLRRQVLRLRTQLNWEITGDDATALNEILQGDRWDAVMDYGAYRDQGKKILKNFKLLLRMGDTGMFLDLYNKFQGTLLSGDRRALVAALIDHGKIDMVRNTLSDYRVKLEGKFQYGYTEEAKILAKAGDKEVALEYLRRVLAHEGCTHLDKIIVLEALVSIGERESALELAQDLLRLPLAAIRAAELMDQLKPGWDHSLSRPVHLLEDPYR